MKNTVKLWIWIGILAILTPLGIIVPYYFKAGSAWGEWGSGEIVKMSGYVPVGFEKLSGLWKAPLREYVFPGWQGKGLAHLSIAYICSALAGIAVIVVISLLLGKILARKDL
jgi:cobalt/nickel transport protein